MKRHREALIIDGGAVNPLPITRALHDAAVEAMEETRSTDAVWQDPAILIMLNQICHMAGIQAAVDLDRYCAVREQCEKLKEV